jgi:uncharacterized membrane protein
LSKRILIAGESWTTHSIHVKGFDSFTTTEYNEGIDWVRAALEANGWNVEHLPSHNAARDFPGSVDALQQYNVVLLSDIGANTLLLHPSTFNRSKVLPNRLNVLAEYVQAGGGLVMAGGYLTFQGIDAKGQYAGSAVEAVLPVTLHRYDDRVEKPEGATPVIADAGHPILDGVPAGAWPALLGYNQVVARPEARLIARIGDDPLLVAGVFGKGRSVAFTSDLAPHWAPPPFLDWAGYAPLWAGICDWAGGLR